MRIQVTCKHCKTRHEERDVTVVDIEEDFQGRDVLTFDCQTCGSVTTSLRRGKR